MLRSTMYMFSPADSFDYVQQRVRCLLWFYGTLTMCMIWICALVEFLYVHALAGEQRFDRGQVAEIVGNNLVNVHKDVVVRFEFSNQGSQVEGVEHALVKKIL